MKSLTDKEMNKVCEMILEDKVGYDCIADDCNDYCGKIVEDELLNISLDAIKEAKNDKKLINEISLETGILPDYLSNIEIPSEICKKITNNLAFNAGIVIL